MLIGTACFLVDMYGLLQCTERQLWIHFFLITRSRPVLNTTHCESSLSAARISRAILDLIGLMVLSGVGFAAP